MKTLYKSFLLVLAVVILFPLLINGQNQDMVNVTPDRCFLGGTINVFGWVKPNHPGDTIVNLEFTKPVSGNKIQERVKTNPDGKYSFQFKETHEIGTWKVAAHKVGTTIKEEAQFEVSHRVFLIPLCLELKQMDEKTTEAYTYFQDVLKNYPDFPGKDDINDTIDELLNDLQQMQALLVPLESDIQQMNNSLQVHAHNLPGLAQKALIDAADTSVKTIEETTKQIKEIQEVIESSKQEAEWCYIWMSYYYLCEQLKFYNNFLSTSLTGIAKSLIIAETTKGLDKNLQTLITKVINRLSRSKQTPVSIANKIMGLMAKLGTRVYGELMKNCTNYTGEAEGEYHAELIHNNMTFFTMFYKISGDVNLTFQKRKPGDPAVYLKGNFKGKASDFACTITMAPFAQPDTIGPVWCLSATPLVARRSFILYIKGKAADDLMELKLDKVGRDFSLKARAFYVLLSSAAYNLPIPGDFEFPLQNAEWFFTRTTKISNPKIEYFQLPIEVKGDTSTAEEEFEREIYLPETKQRVGVKIYMKLKITVCSPKCK